MRASSAKGSPRRVDLHLLLVEEDASVGEAEGERGGKAGRNSCGGGMSFLEEGGTLAL